MRQGVDAASHLLGLTEARTDREPAVLTLRLGAPHEAGLTVIDRRDGPDRTYRLDLQADDLAEQIAAIRGGRPEGRAKVIVDPAACFIRTLDLPSAALPRMRAVLAQELEAATPFRADQVFSDWYVEGEDPETRTLRVRHVVLKRARLGPVLAALAGAGLKASVVAVGPAEDRTMPVDLLSSGHHALPSLLRSSGNLVLVAATGLFLLGAFLGLRQHQAATLSALDDAFATARRAASSGLPPAIQAGAAAMLSRREERIKDLPQRLLAHPRPIVLDGHERLVVFRSRSDDHADLVRRFHGVLDQIDQELLNLGDVHCHDQTIF